MWSRLMNYEATQVARQMWNIALFVHTFIWKYFVSNWTNNHSLIAAIKLNKLICFYKLKEKAVSLSINK